MVFGTCHTLPYYAILTHALDFGTPESWTEFVKFVQLCHLVCVSKWQGVAVRRERLKWGYNLVLPIFVQNDLFGHGDTTACLKQIVSGTSLRKWKPSHTHTQHTLHAYTILHLHFHSGLHTHTTQQWQGDQPSSDPRKEARWKRSGSGKGPSKPINKPNMPVSTSQRARNIHSM